MMPVFNVLFSILESAALLLLVPVTLVAVAALLGATALVRRKLRHSGPAAGSTHLWIRGYQREA
jgi:hypothetical protein